MVSCAYSGDSSIPMHFLPVLRAAMAVVPPPMKGSRIVPFAGHIPMRLCNRGDGFACEVNLCGGVYGVTVHTGETFTA